MQLEMQVWSSREKLGLEMLNRGSTEAIIMSRTSKAIVLMAPDREERRHFWQNVNQYTVYFIEKALLPKNTS